MTDHHAIIPTGRVPEPGGDPRVERLWRVVAARFVVAFAPNATGSQVERSLTLAAEAAGGGAFAAHASGKTYASMGWKAVEAALAREGAPSNPGDGGEGGAAPDGDGDLWFQLYLTKNRPQSFDLVSRAADNGFSTLVVTVDTIVAGNRVRDLRNGLSIPPALTLSTVASVAMKPSYWYHLLAGPALDYANFAGRAPTTGFPARLTVPPLNAEKMCV